MSSVVKQKLQDIYDGENTNDAKRGLAITVIMVYDGLPMGSARNALDAWLGV